jgi:hypothetical protein
MSAVPRGDQCKPRANAEVRGREYLTQAEVEKLIAAAGDNRNGHRDATVARLIARPSDRSF